MRGSLTKPAFLELALIHANQDENDLIFIDGLTLIEGCKPGFFRVAIRYGKYIYLYDGEWQPESLAETLKTEILAEITKRYTEQYLSDEEC